MVIVQFRGHLVRQYRACVADSLGLGITCVISLYTICTRHANLVSFAIPIFHIQIRRIFTFTCLLSFLITSPNPKSVDHIGAGTGIQQCYEQQKNTTS